MASLTTVAQTTRKVIIFLLFAFVIGTFLFFIFSSIRKSLIAIKPLPPPVISTTFGQIPKAEFTQQLFPFDIKFTIETISGKLAEASPTAKIYFLSKKQQGLLTNIRAAQDAKKLGFTNEPQIIDKKLVFKATGKEFTIDPITRDFIYSYDYINDGSVFEGNTKLIKSLSISQTTSFLNLFDALPDDYDSQNPTTTFLTFNGAQFIPTGNETDEINATTVRVDFFRKKVDNLNVVTPKYNEGNIYVITSKASDKDKQIVKAQKSYQEISNENFGIYPLRNIQTAWEDFLKGNGYIANPGNSTFTKRMVIRDAFVAYYDNPPTQSYLLPIYVFTGDNGFVGYTNAISPEWLNQ